ncbi:MAG: hypothetical protein ABIJ50_15345 [Pseudomonadota bacterium]
MEKKEYVTPQVLEHGDVKDFTLSGGSSFSHPDSNYIGSDGNAYTTYDPS